MHFNSFSSTALILILLLEDCDPAVHTKVGDATALSQERRLVDLKHLNHFNLRHFGTVEFIDSSYLSPQTYHHIKQRVLRNPYSGEHPVSRIVWADFPANLQGLTAQQKLPLLDQLRSV